MLNELLLGRSVYCRRKYRQDEASENRWARISRVTQDWIRARMG